MRRSFLIFCLLLAAPLFAEYDPIAVYLTWQRAPDTTMTIQWISKTDRKEGLVDYQRVGESCWKQAQGQQAPMPEKYPYLIHGVELTQLLPDTDYRFRIGSDGVIYLFRTMPSTQTRPIRFVVGGDIYQDSWELLEQMNRHVALLDPLFVLVGGDLVYNDRKANLSKDMPRWLEWLIAWKQQMVTPAGRLIPIIPAIGNHDVEKKRKSAPYFYALFPMPGPQGYNVLDFGKYLSVILLDTGHTQPIAGAQTEWLQKTLEERKQVPHKLALYHVPAYPCVRDYHNSESATVRKYWVPLFDQLGLQMAFENHDHAYKRTWPLRGGKVDPAGVLYLGDGGWAVKKARVPRAASKTWYLAKSQASRNCVLVILHGATRHFIAYDEQGKIIDEYFK